MLQLRRQIDSQFYERTALSRNKAAMLRKGAAAKPEDAVSPEEAIKDPYVLEFLGLKDEYSESDLEAALIARLEAFLLELGDDFTFVGRQRRLRLDDVWYRVDLLFFHRRLRCLVVIDLKLDKLTHADVGQMHLYLNYAREHWTRAGENPPVGLILCAGKREAVARYALEGLPNKILAAEYRTMLPDEKTIAAELEQTRHVLEERKHFSSKRPASGTRRGPRNEAIDALGRTARPRVSAASARRASRGAWRSGRRRSPSGRRASSSTCPWGCRRSRRSAPGRPCRSGRRRRASTS